MQAPHKCECFQGTLRLGFADKPRIAEGSEPGAADDRFPGGKVLRNRVTAGSEQSFNTVEATFTESSLCERKQSASLMQLLLAQELVG